MVRKKNIYRSMLLFLILNKRQILYWGYTMIKFVREYNFFNTKMHDIVYPNRCRTCMEKDLPKPHVHLFVPLLL